MKTEQAGTVINTTAGAKTELLGALIYPGHRCARRVSPPSSLPMLMSPTSTRSPSTVSAADTPVQVNETRSRQSRTR